MSREVVEPSFDERIRVMAARKYAAILFGVPALLGSAFVASNPNLVQSIVTHVTYEEPDEGDIIPVMDSCKVDPLRMPSSGPFRAITLPAYIPEKDDSLQLYANKTSAAGSMPIRNPEGFIEHERLFWPFDNYFDRNQITLKHSSGANFEFWSKDEDRLFDIDATALEQMIKDIFAVSTMTRPGYYENNQGLFAIHHRLKNPQARQISECRRKAIFDDGELEGVTIRAHIVANRDKKLHGNNVVTLTPGYRTKSHSHGLGTPEVSIDFLGLKLSPEQTMIITGGSSYIEDDEEALNRLFMHELIHVLFFRDLQETLGDRDRQERYVKYLEEAMWNYYKEKQSFPRVIVTQDT